MAYFANGTEALCYEETYCIKCQHYGKEDRCPVLLAHWYCASNQDAKFHEDSSPERLVLDEFISRDINGVNQRCTMMMEIPAHLDVDWDKIMAGYMKDVADRQKPDDIEVISEPRAPEPVPCEGR